MTRKISHTSMSDECHFDPACPFDCPLKTCVKEYPGGEASYLKDKQFMDLLASGMDIYQAGKEMGISPAAVERRYAHAIGVASNKTSQVQTA